MIYVLKHPNKGFTGHAGVDFHNGIGSTSSKFDADIIAEKIGAEIALVDPDAPKAKADSIPADEKPAKGGKKTG